MYVNMIFMNNKRRDKMSTTKKEVEMVYGIYFGEKIFMDDDRAFYGPVGERQAGCVIRETQPDHEIIANLVASDFLNQWHKYEVEDNSCSIHIFHKINGKRAGLALVLSYEEDLEPFHAWTRIEA
jgi:hypothetical protein